MSPKSTKARLHQLATDLRTAAPAPETPTPPAAPGARPLTQIRPKLRTLAPRGSCSRSRWTTS